MNGLSIHTTAARKPTHPIPLSKGEGIVERRVFRYWRMICWWAEAHPTFTFTARREPRPPAQQMGFSLLELIMVVSILAIVLGTIIPNLKPLLEGTAVNRTTSLTADILRYARSSAIEHSQQTKITFNQENGDLLYTVEDDPFQAPGVFVEKGLPIEKPKDLGDSVQIANIQKNSLTGSQEQNVISFNTDGSTSDTFIYFTDDTQKVYTIGIVGLTGQVLVWDKSVESFYAE